MWGEGDLSLLARGGGGVSRKKTEKGSRERQEREEDGKMSKEARPRPDAAPREGQGEEGGP